MASALHHEPSDYANFDYEGYTSNPNISFLEEEKSEMVAIKLRWRIFGACVAVVIGVPSAYKIIEWGLGR